jgi:hypothetical protein
MFRFGWLTIAADDLAVWEQFPDAAFALVKTASMRATDKDLDAKDLDAKDLDAKDLDAAEEFHLGAFGLPEKTTLGEH